MAVVQATDVGAIGSNPKILGRDGGYSGLFAGISVWAFGDTFLANPNAEGQTLISDSWEWTTNLNASDRISGFQEREDTAAAPAMLLQLSATEQAFNTAHQGNPCAESPCGARWALWPGAVVADPARSRALVFYQLVMAQPGAFNFYAAGFSVATWNNFAGLPQRPVISPGAAHPDLIFGQTAPSFGTAAFADGNTLYAYGCTSSGIGSVSCVVGRVSLADVLDPNAWSFYAGNGIWSSYLGDAVTVMQGAPIMNVSWNDYLQCYVAIYNKVLSRPVVMRTAPAPEGPWSREVLAFEALAPAGGGTVHDAQAHPEFNGNGGQIMYVTYSHSTGEFLSELRLVEVKVEPVAKQ
jgi:hypothetical protein